MTLEADGVGLNSGRPELPSRPAATADPRPRAVPRSAMVNEASPPTGVALDGRLLPTSVDFGRTVREMNTAYIATGGFDR
jgi:hypothetical protein